MYAEILEDVILTEIGIPGKNIAKKVLNRITGKEARNAFLKGIGVGTVGTGLATAGGLYLHNRKKNRDAADEEVIERALAQESYLDTADLLVLAEDLGIDVDEVLSYHILDEMV